MHRRRHVLGALASGLRAAAAAASVTRDVMVAMGDGIRLSSDVYRPATGGAAATDRRPSLLMRTPYDIRDRPIVAQAEWSRVMATSSCCSCFG